MAEVKKEESKKEEVKKEEAKPEIKFYDDLNREVSEDYSGKLENDLVAKIKASYVYNEILNYDKQLVLVIDEEEIVISNEDARKLLK